MGESDAMRTLRFLLCFLAASLSGFAADVLVVRPSYAWAYTNLLSNTNLFTGAAGQALVFDENGMLVPGNVSAVFEGDVPDPLTVTNLTILDTLDIDAMSVNSIALGDGTGIGGTKIDVRWFGAIADDSNSDYDAFEDAAAYCQATGGILYIPPGEYEFAANGNYINNTTSLIVEGAGPDSILKHTGNTAANAMFGFSTGTNLVLRNFKIKDARYGVNIAAGHPENLNILLDNVTFENCNYGVFASQTPDGSQNWIDSVTLRNVKFFGGAEAVNYVGAGVWLFLTPVKQFTAQNCFFKGGRYGIRIELEDNPIALISYNWNNRVIIDSCWFENQTHSTASYRAISCVEAFSVIRSCTFKGGDQGTPASADRQAIYLYGGGGAVRDCYFDQYDADPTIYFKGWPIAVDPNAMSGTYNNAIGWGVLVEGNTFRDDTAGSVGCGLLGLDSDGISIVRNNWIDFAGTTKTLIDYNPSGTYSEVGFLDIIGNKFVRCKALTYFEPADPIQNVRINENLWYNCNPGGTHYAVRSQTFASFKNLSFERNTIFACPSMQVMLLYTRSNITHNSIRYIGNYVTNASIGLVGNASTAAYGNTGGWTNLVFSDNRFEAVATPIWFSDYATITDGVVANNKSVGATYAFPRGSAWTNVNTAIYNNTDSSVVNQWPIFTFRSETPEAKLTANPGSFALVTNSPPYIKMSGAGNTGWYTLPPFYGVTTSTPTTGLVAGGSFLSNSVWYIYNGSAFVAP